MEERFYQVFTVGRSGGREVSSLAMSQPRAASRRFGDELEHWLNSDADKTLGGLVDLFGPKGFAIAFVFLLGVPALPLPTGGATHVFEAIAVLLALQLIGNRSRIWLPRRWRGVELGGPGQQRFVGAVVKAVRRLERVSRPRLAFVFGHRLGNVVFGALVVVGSLGAFLAPPFSGLDTLPALGVVLLSLGVLLEDFAVVTVGVLVGTAGVVLEIALGRVVVEMLSS
ncbi:MAG TPA: exopolysaccharide biosynthesis protein [Solirubrobacterales bacterium]|nr:exopolysaccharide biosynthesis protein [Solirubrobacterales bacterium]